MVNISATAVEVVDQLRDGPFVAGDVARGKDNGVPFFQLDLFVSVHGDPDQGRHRFPLAAGGDDADLFRRQMVQLPYIHQQIICDGQIAQIPCNTYVVNHGSAI